MTSPLRTDILAISDEKLAELTNIGLVKRAKKALDNGDVPRFDWDNDTLIATFADTHSVTWQPNQILADTTCTCLMPLCRHRVQTTIAYRQAHNSQDNPNQETSQETSDNTSYCTITLNELKKFTTAALLKNAKNLCRYGLVIKLTPKQNKSFATAILPMATVKFLGDNNLIEARCNCRQTQGCEHIFLAGLAWHLSSSPPSDFGEIAITSQQIDQYFAKTPQQSNQPNQHHHALAHHQLSTIESDLFLALFQDGAMAGLQRYERLFKDAYAVLAQNKELWLEHILDDLQKWLTAYENRYNQFDGEMGLNLLTEYALRSVARQNPLIGQSVLGVNLSMETPMSILQLLAVGCRIRPIPTPPTERYYRYFVADVMFVDVKTQTFLSFEHQFSTAKSLDKPNHPKDLQRQTVTHAINLTKFATGQLIAHKAKRLANHKLALNFGRKTNNQILPSEVDWQQVAKTCPPIFYAKHNLPDFLQSRYHQPNFCLLTLTHLDQHGYDPANQQYVATATDKDGRSWLLYRQHQNYTPCAIQTMAGVLGKASLPMVVAGVRTYRNNTDCLEVWSMISDRMYVLDIESDFVEDNTLYHAPKLHLSFDDSHQTQTSQALIDFYQNVSSRLIFGSYQQSFNKFLQTLTPYQTKFKQLGLDELSDMLTNAIDKERFDEFLAVIARVRLYLSASPID